MKVKVTLARSIFYYYWRASENNRRLVNNSCGYFYTGLIAQSIPMAMTLISIVIEMPRLTSPEEDNPKIRARTTGSSVSKRSLFVCPHESSSNYGAIVLQFEDTKDKFQNSKTDF
jgi:hypothetical protein